MEKIIATVVSIILVLGLISYAILAQVEKVKDTGDIAQMEQDKIKQIVQDPNVVSGNTVKDYVEQASANFTVVIDYADTNITDQTITSSSTTTSVKDTALFKITRKYNVDGELDEVDFVQVDLSK